MKTFFRNIAWEIAQDYAIRKRKKNGRWAYRKDLKCYGYVITNGFNHTQWFIPNDYPTNKTYFGADKQHLVVF